MSKHTQGEWIADRGFRDVSGRDGNHTTRDDDFLTVAMGDDEENYIEVHGPNQKANAALAEAAPELLALAEKVATLNPNAGEIGEGMLHRLVSMANEAITKATS